MDNFGEIIAFVRSYIDSHGGGGGGGTTNYNELNNRPQINGTTLTGNKSASDLGLLGLVEVDGTKISF